MAHKEDHPHIVVEWPVDKSIPPNPGAGPIQKIGGCTVTSKGGQAKLPVLPFELDPQNKYRLTVWVQGNTEVILEV
jgi:hypothetical protein